MLTEDDLIGEDEVEWNLRVNGVDFSTSIVLSEDESVGARRAEAEERAREQLIEALENGSASIDWNVSTETRDSQEYTLEIQQSCERCGDTYPDASHLREIDTESDDYEPDFEYEGRYVLVCEDCRKEFWTWPDEDDETNED